MTALEALLTPTGVLLGHWAVHSPEWYAARRCGIGSSDIPAIVGSSDYRTKLHVYLDKRGELPDEESVGEAGDWGNLLEDVIAREWARRNDRDVVEVGTLSHVEHPWRLANLDRLVRGCSSAAARIDRGVVCALEVKTRNAWSAGSWREDVPDDVLAQVQWQLHVTGLDHLHVACLVGGQRLVEHTVTPDPAVIAYLVREASALWDCVHAGVMPHVDPGALLLDLLDRLHPDRVGVTEVDLITVMRIRADYRAGHDLERRAKDAKDTAKAELVALLGPGNTARDSDGRTLATYRPDLRESIDRDLLKARYPDAHAACVSKKPTKPVLRWTKEI